MYYDTAYLAINACVKGLLLTIFIAVFFVEVKCIPVNIYMRVTSRVHQRVNTHTQQLEKLEFAVDLIFMSCLSSFHSFTDNNILSHLDKIVEVGVGVE